MKKMSVKLTLVESMLGTSPADPDVYGSYIGSNAPDAATMQQEIEALGVEEVQAKGRTICPKLEDGRPFLYDYQIKGFFKDACSMLARVKDSDHPNRSSQIKAFKKVIDGLIFPQPRKIPINFEGEIGDCQRPLRANTAQGERVSLASSDEIPAGATLEFDILCLNDKDLDAVREWLDYGILRGLGQWRNSGKGRFTWEEIVDSKA